VDVTQRQEEQAPDDACRLLADLRGEERADGADFSTVESLL